MKKKINNLKIYISRSVKIVVWVFSVLVLIILGGHKVTTALSSNYILYETGTPQESASNTFWLNSGAAVTQYGQTIQTLHGVLPWYNSWHLKYMLSTPTDTNYGNQPQNIFRLLQKVDMQNPDQSVYFRIDSFNSPLALKHAPDGIFLMSHYIDGDNLFYVGIRMDGNAVIKKKEGGRYTTLAITPLFNSLSQERPSQFPYLPKDTWLGLRSTIEENTDGTVNITLSIDEEFDLEWKEVLSVTAAPLPNASKGKLMAGLRSDFMDITFYRYTLNNDIAYLY